MMLAGILPVVLTSLYRTRLQSCASSGHHAGTSGCTAKPQGHGRTPLGMIHLLGRRQQALNFVMQRPYDVPAMQMSERSHHARMRRC